MNTSNDNNLSHSIEPEIDSSDSKWIKPELKLLNDQLIDGKAVTSFNEPTPFFGPS